MQHGLGKSQDQSINYLVTGGLVDTNSDLLATSSTKMNVFKKHTSYTALCMPSDFNLHRYKKQNNT